MAAGAGGTPPPPTPLRLKDLLELDCDSCSAAGFRCYPRRLGDSAPAAPMRHLLDSSSPSSLRLPRRHRRTSSSKLSHLSRSLSRRLSLSRRGGGFWSRRREDEEHEDAAAAAAAANATGCGSRSPEEMETSSSSESSDISCGRTSRRSRSESDSDFSSATGDGDAHEVVTMKRVVSEAEQEQLSPVAVMDFPFDDDDDGDELRDAAVACSPPSFSLERLQRFGHHKSSAKNCRSDRIGRSCWTHITSDDWKKAAERRKTHKIRRFGSRDELPPLNLEALLAATSDTDDGPAAIPPQQHHQQMFMIQCRTEDGAATPTSAGSSVHDVPHGDDDGLISLLMGTPPVVSAGGLDGASERLLLDLFVETMRRRRSEAHAEADERVVDDGDEAAVAAEAARDWLEGMGTERWGLTDVLRGGAAIVAEMDQRGRRWMQVGEEEREVAAVVAGMLLDQLVDEVVRCLFV